MKILHNTTNLLKIVKIDFYIFSNIVIKVSVQISLSGSLLFKVKKLDIFIFYICFMERR